MTATNPDWFVDSNVLLRFSDKTSLDQSLARAALRRIRGQNNGRCLGLQNLAEFWSVTTRPTAARGGMGFTVQQANRYLRGFRRLFTLLPETNATILEWQRLVVTHNVLGVNAHDARLAALMNTHGITHLLTFNAKDFARFGIVAVHPQDV